MSVAKFKDDVQGKCLFQHREWRVPETHYHWLVVDTDKIGAFKHMDIQRMEGFG